MDLKPGMLVCAVRPVSANLNNDFVSYSGVNIATGAWFDMYPGMTGVYMQ